MRRLIAKLALIGLQSSAIVILVGYILLRTQWVVVPGLISAIALWGVNCGNCGTSFDDPRLYKRIRLLRFWDTGILDKCPVCGEAMLEKRR